MHDDPLLIGVIVAERHTAQAMLTVIEAGRRALRCEGLNALPPELERVVDRLRVLAGHGVEPVTVPTVWITTDAAARRLGVTRQHVGRLAGQGVLRSQRVGRRLLVAELDVEAEMQLRTYGNPSEPPHEPPGAQWAS